MTLEPYEEEVLERMYDKEIIMMRYKPIQRGIRGMIHWDEIAQKYGIKKSLKNVLRRLGSSSKGYVSDHGKSWEVASLTEIGVQYVLGKRGGSVKPSGTRIPSSSRAR